MWSELLFLLLIMINNMLNNSYTYLKTELLDSKQDKRCTWQFYKRPPNVWSNKYHERDLGKLQMLSIILLG